jgi:hypothetical protein
VFFKIEKSNPTETNSSKRYVVFLWCLFHGYRNKTHKTMAVFFSDANMQLFSGSPGIGDGLAIQPDLGASSLGPQQDPRRRR